MKTNAEIGALIRAKREGLGMTRDELAKELGISASALAMYETGKRRPKQETGKTIADYFMIPASSLYFDDDDDGGVLLEDELEQIREDFRRNPELRTLHSLQRNLTRRELKQTEAFIRAIRSSRDYDGDDTP